MWGSRIQSRIAKHHVIVKLHSLTSLATNMLTCSAVSSGPQDRTDAGMLHFLIASLALKHEVFFRGRVVSVACTCLKQRSQCYELKARRF
jgi:hypothetical protein